MEFVVGIPLDGDLVFDMSAVNDRCPKIYSSDGGVYRNNDTSADCQNPCGTCELCGSKKRRDLPRECRGMPSEDPVNTCDDDGQRVCDEANPCPETYYCQLGCCRIIVL